MIDFFSFLSQLPTQFVRLMKISILRTYKRIEMTKLCVGRSK